MSDWFTVKQLDKDTYSISEYKHWEESHSYLLIGNAYGLLIDTGLGIGNIGQQVMKLTDRPIIAVATHVHWDHIGGHKYFPNFYVHADEANWLNGAFPLPLDLIRSYVTADCDLPLEFNIDDYDIFQGHPAKVLRGSEIIDIGGRKIQVMHTPGHSPGHMCFYEKERAYLFAGDLVYMGTLFAYYPSTDPAAYWNSTKQVAQLPVERVFPAHHDPNVPSSILTDVEHAFSELKAAGKLHHGSGKHDYEYFSIWL